MHRLWASAVHAGRRLGIYTFMFLDGPQISAMLEFDDCADDAQARTRALELLTTTPERDGVEFWREGGEPMKVTRAELPSD